MKTKIESFAGVPSCNLSVSVQPEELTIFENFMSSHTFDLCHGKKDSLTKCIPNLKLSMCQCYCAYHQYFKATKYYETEMFLWELISPASCVLRPAWMRKYIGAKTCWNGGSSSINDCRDLFPFQNPAGCTPPHVLRSGGVRNTVDKIWDVQSRLWEKFSWKLSIKVPHEPREVGNVDSFDVLQPQRATLTTLTAV